MRNRFPGVIGFKMAFGDVCRLVTIVDQDVVPRLIFRRSTRRNLVVPFIRELEVLVDVDDHAAILKPSMVNHLSIENMALESNT